MDARALHVWGPAQDARDRDRDVQSDKLPSFHRLSFERPARASRRQRTHLPKGYLPQCLVLCRCGDGLRQLAGAREPDLYASGTTLLDDGNWQAFPSPEAQAR